MKDRTYRLLLVADLDKKEELAKRLIAFKAVKIVEKKTKAIEDVERMYALVSELAERAGIRPEAGYTDILMGRTIRKVRFEGKTVKEILESISTAVGGTINELEKAVSELESVETKLSSAESELVRISPISFIDYDLSFTGSLKRICVKIYISKDEPFKPQGAIVSTYQLNGSYVNIIVCKAEDEQIIVKAAGELGLTQVSPPAYNPAKRASELNKIIEELRAKREDLLKRVNKIKAMAEDEVSAALEALTALREALELGEPRGRFLFVRVEVPSLLYERFSKVISDIAVISDPEKGEDIELVNPIYIKNFEQVTETQGVPSEHEIDPTPIIAFVFPLFFGFMFPDLGQGLVLLAVGLLIYFRGWRTKRMWGALLATFGAAASISGLLSGEFFGFDVSLLPGVGPYLARLAIVKIPTLSSLTAGIVLGALALAILIGIFHLASGFFLDFYQTVKHDRLRAYAEKLTALLAYAGAVLIGLSIIGGGYNFNLFSGRAALIGIPNIYVSAFSVPVTVASLAVMIYFMLREMGPLNSMIQFMFVVIEFLANTISYSRLAILFLVHIILMKALNLTLGMGILSIPILLIGNLGIMALEGLIVYIQALRLHIYEWGTKFYMGGGKRFKGLGDLLLHADLLFKA